MGRITNLNARALLSDLIPEIFVVNFGHGALAFLFTSISSRVHFGGCIRVLWMHSISWQPRQTVIVFPSFCMCANSLF